MAFFKQLTLGQASPGQINAVIMGRKTWESLPARSRPLPARYIIVVSSQSAFRAALNTALNVRACTSFQEAVEAATSNPHIAQVFIIGGVRIYREALHSKLCRQIYLTQVLKQYECDTFLPPIDASRFRVVQSGDVQVERGVPYQMITLEAKKTEIFLGHEEQQYLDLIQLVLEKGNKRGDRTGVGTLSRFGAQFRFSLEDQFPLLTTKQVLFRGVAEELLWMIRGCTDAQELSAKGVKIWEGNGSRAFLDQNGFPERREGDLGPVASSMCNGLSARAEYKGPDVSYEGKGHDQLKEVLELIKNSPDSRRIVMSAWNAPDVRSMALPPCHVLAQFYVHEKKLSCHLYQRSADLGLGVPFNIASYSLLTYLLAHVTGLQPGEFIHSFGDAYVYLNHVEALREQLKRNPRPFPKLKIKSEAKDIFSIKYSDLELVGYNPYPSIKMDLAV